MEPFSSWLLTITKRYGLLIRTDMVLLLCMICHGYIGVFLLVKTLTFASSLVISLIIFLQLLSTQIGISGHIHRLMAGSMAGRAINHNSVSGIVSRISLILSLLSHECID